MSEPTLTYGLGCPLWSLADWEGQLYRAGSTSGDYLAQYASVFSAVEGNTTFYAVPAKETVARWLGQVPEGFRFCFKFPRTISHEHRLHRAEHACREFLDRLRPLQSRLGPLMLQLPASFGPPSVPVLLDFLDALPTDFTYAVELRQRRFFEDDALSDRLDEVLRERHVERIMLDSRPLRSGDAGHPDVLTAAHEKPDLPVRVQALSTSPLVRLITHPDVKVTAPWLDRWADVVLRWMTDGLRPLLFIHCPNNVHSPLFARTFHQRLAVKAAALGVDVGTLSLFPGESGPPGSRADEQLTLL
ncbi:MAG: DUF72 domain-containing protein [Pseudomonadota bacterium]